MNIIRKFDTESKLTLEKLVNGLITEIITDTVNLHTDKNKNLEMHKGDELIA